MQIFIRFAYGKVITVDICKGITKVTELHQEIKKRFGLPPDFEYELVLKRKDKPDETIPKDSDELVCKDNRVTTNTIIDFIESSKNKKIKEAKLRSQVKVNNKYEWKEDMLLNITPFTTVEEVKNHIRDIIKIDPIRQRVFVGNQELLEPKKKLNEYGVEVYDILRVLYRKDPDKLKKIEENNKVVFYCIERIIELLTVVMCVSGVPGTTSVNLLMSMKVIDIKKLAYNKFPELTNPPIAPENIDATIKLTIDTTLTNESNITVQDLKAKGKIKAGSKLYFTNK